MAEETAVNHIAKLSAATLSSRLIIEMAVCECPVNGGMISGRLEFADLMTDCALLFYTGGHSDAIRYEAMPAEIEISAGGDILMIQDLTENVVQPLGFKLQASILNSNLKIADQFYSAPKISESSAADAGYEPEFIVAWNEEFGFSIDEIRYFLDAVENYGIEITRAVFPVSRSELIDRATASGKISSPTVEKIIQRFSLGPRPRWDIAPKGFLTKSWYPWAFRRQLSLVSRPLVRLIEGEGEVYLLAPGIIRDAVIYVIRNAYRGNFDPNYFWTRRMRDWIGRRRNVAGHKFNAEVAKRLIALGWKSKANVKLPEILNRKLERDYGDVDVLAWRDADEQILCIECKDLSFDKTFGEIAERLFEYRGEDDQKGRPDRLKRHISRIDVLRAEAPAVARYVKKTGQVKIVPSFVFDQLTPMHFMPSEAMRSMVVCAFAELAALGTK